MGIRQPYTLEEQSSLEGKLNMKKTPLGKKPMRYVRTLTPAFWHSRTEFLTPGRHGSYNVLQIKKNCNELLNKPHQGASKGS